LTAAASSEPAPHGRNKIPPQSSNSYHSAMPKAQHPKASLFVRQNLFARIGSFEELEARIAALPDEQARGDAFEVFAEAYLATQRKHDAAAIWPLSSVPTLVLQSLGLGPQDYGVDGVFRTLLGHLSAYQVKFRTNRPSLTWRELSTFIGLADSPQIRSRVLITNCDDLPALLNERHGFFCIRGSDLDRLEATDFDAVEAWLTDAAFTAPKKLPQPHQTEALDALLPALQAYDRVSAIMACGTGKTLLALWVAERRQASQVLVLVPSLALLRQILHEWLRETSLPSLAYLCVCSDPTVKEGLDEIATVQSDLDFQVTTDTANVRDFLDVPFTGTKIVFTTYQSARVVGTALKPGEAFDLAVFDEAHKTAGREGRNYAFALEDANLPIRKRLFLTATPRHYNPHQHDREGEAQLVFSMDRPDVYGPQAFRLTFADAAQRGIICGYKVIISVITSEMVTNELLRLGEVVVSGSAVRARQVANQIALCDAIEEYGASKVFTFHKTVKSAASFVADGSEGVRTHLPEFGTFHVNGTMPTARRESQMRDFRTAARAIMSNARCLTEGVDVPAVDMVAFLSPRRSRVDIVQATGRAMRRSPGKTTGYVLVPLYVELAAGETVEAAVNRGEFSEVWDVLHSLQEQDDVLAELIRYVGERMEPGKGFDDSRLADRIDFGGPRLTLETLRAAVTTRCLERLYTPWDAAFGRLKAFRDRFGHCNVKNCWEEDPVLARWVNQQRVRRTRGLLSAERIALLEKIGFAWEWRKLRANETWMKWYRELEAYAREHGNPHVPSTHAKTKLAGWVWGQRLRRDGPYGGYPPLTDEQIALLDKLGFRWDANEGKWDAYLEQLKRFKEQHGHCEVGSASEQNDDLRQWVRLQRRMNTQGTLDAGRKAKLDAAGFSWTAEVYDRAWDEMYERLKKYQAQHGDADVPCQWKDDSKLAGWVRHQRHRRKKGLLADEQVRLLDELRFTWEHRQPGSWDDRYQELVEFKAEHGHCDVPSGYKRKPKLAGFVNAMRGARKSGKLSAERLAKLEAVGFAWASVRATNQRIDNDGINAFWQVRFDELLRYRLEHGNCDVPARWRENPELGHWVSAQRQLRKSGRLHLERHRRLDEIGFDWRSNSRREEWATRFEQLKAYKERFGHCCVPVEWQEIRGLGRWVAKQRHHRKNGRLSPEKERSLAAIGFE
jgi:superfamily II DNA or RNA helicase